MRLSQGILHCGLSLILLGMLSGQTLAQKSTDVIAEVGSVSLTLADLDQQESAKLLQARFDFYQAENKALDDLIDRTLLEQKAKSEHLSVDELLDQDVKSKIKDPTDDQMRVYYEGVETDQPYEAVHDKILEKIRQLRFIRGRTAYVQMLRAQSTVSIFLAPPSTKVDLENANVSGPKNAPVMLVEFADYECPYCQRVAPEIKKLQDEFGEKLALVYKDFPLPMHAHAEKAAEAVRCAGKQDKFWDLHDQLFRSKELDLEQIKNQAHALNVDAAKFDNCLDTGETAAEVKQDRDQGMRLGLTGTPSFFVNDHFLSGALDYATLRKVIDQQLKQSQIQRTIAAK